MPIAIEVLESVIGPYTNVPIPWGSLMGMPASQCLRSGMSVLNFAPKKRVLVIEFDLVRISKPGISLISLACPDSVARSPDWSLILRSGFRFKIDSTAAVVQVRSAHVH